jgi:hypothetical protein
MSNHNANVDNNAENNNNANPPPPPLPTLEQVLAMQAHMLRIMQHTTVNMQNAQHQAPPLPPRDKLGDFLRTKPPTFYHTIEPLNADDWFMSV